MGLVVLSGAAVRTKKKGADAGIAAVWQDVLDQTRNQQEPFVYGSLRPTNFYFVPPK
jgi:hypothetical protein